jgi:hypothetical protein
MLNRSRLLALGLLLFVQSGCPGSIVDDYGKGEAVLMGTVTTASGDGVQDATVDVKAFVSIEELYSGSTATDSSGAFSLFMRMPGSMGGDARLVVSVTPPVGSNLQSATEEIEPVRFHEDAMPVLDTAWVNIVLEPIPGLGGDGNEVTP